VARGARDKSIALPPGLFLDWRDQTLLDGGSGGTSVTVPAPLDKLPLLLVDGTLLPLLDASIDTLVDATAPGIVGPAAVANVYDVVGLVSTTRGDASFTLADGGVVAAAYSGGLAGCSGCTITRLSPRLQRVQVEASAVDAGGLHLLSSGISRRLRWDLYIVD
jgi:hypothetical protein